MQAAPQGPDIEKSALLIVDMQNDFLHRDGSFAHVARENPEAKIDILSTPERKCTGGPE